MWRKFDEFDAHDLRQVSLRYSADRYICMAYMQTEDEYRSTFGYFFSCDGNLICRRQLNQIRNWQATSHLEV